MLSRQGELETGKETSGPPTWPRTPESTALGAKRRRQTGRFYLEGKDVKGSREEKSKQQDGSREQRRAIGEREVRISATEGGKGFPSRQSGGNVSVKRGPKNVDKKEKEDGLD